MEEDEDEFAQYRQLQENAIRVPGMDEADMFQDMASLYFDGEYVSPPDRRREEAMLDMGLPAPNELDMLRSARSGPERMPNMGVLDDMISGFDHPPFDMSIMDRDFDLFGPPPVSDIGTESLFPDDYPPIERGPPDPMAAFYGEPQPDPRRLRRHCRSRSITSGYELPPGARLNPGLPTEFRMEDHLMGNPQANMLLGVRPLADVGGTPMPGSNDFEPLPMTRRNLPPRW
jgi:hypothetical protein